MINFYKGWHQVFVNFPTHSRYTLGARIDALSIEIAELLYSSTFIDMPYKISIIKKISQKLDSLKFLIRLSWEVKNIDNKKYAFLSEHLQNIGRQLGGWIKQLKSNPAL